MDEYDEIIKKCHYDQKETEVILIQLLRLAEADGIFDECEKMWICRLIKKHSHHHYSHIDELFPEKDKELDFSAVRHPEHMLLYMIMLAYCDGKLSEEEWIQIKETAYIMSISDKRLGQLHTIVRQKLYSTLFKHLSTYKVTNEIKKQFLSQVRNCLSLATEIE